MTPRAGAPALALGLLLAACGPRGPRAVLMTVDGWAPADPASPRAALRRAEADALRRAVEKGAGVTLAARTRIRDGAAVGQRIVADAAGCVRRHEIVEQRESPRGVSVVVRAEVLRGAQACAGRPPIPPAALEEAEISVSVEGRGPHGAEGASAAEAALRAALSGRGWRVVERSSRLRLDGRALLRETRDSRLGHLSSSMAVVSLRMTDEKGRRVLHEQSGAGAAADPDAAAAARRAAQEAAEDAAPALAEAMEAKLWELMERN